MRRGYLIAAVFTRRCLEWQRRHRRLAVALLLALLFAGLVPFLVFAVTFTRDTAFMGNVGIGTMSPVSKLQVTTSGAAAIPPTSGTTPSTGELIRLRTSSDTAGGIGTIGLSTNQMWIQATDATNLGATYALLLNPNGGGVYFNRLGGFGDQYDMSADSGTNILGLNTAGTGAQTMVRFLTGENTNLAGTITTNTNSTAYNTSSDRRIKENIATTTLGLDALMRLSVRDFSFIKDPTHTTTTGFIAQELLDVFPWAVSTNGDNGIDPLTGSSTPWGVDYGRITPLLVKAVQEIANLTDSFKQTLTSWLASAENGITDLYAKVIYANEVHAKELCAQKSDGTDVCVTGDQLAAAISGSSSSAPASTSVRK